MLHVRFPFMCLAAIAFAVPCLAQASRGIEFLTTLDDGREVILTLSDDDFDSPTYGGSLTFTGWILDGTGSPARISITTDLDILRAGTTNHVATHSTTTTAIGFVPSQAWVALSETQINGATTLTQVQNDGTTASLTMQGDFSDLEQASSGIHASGSLALALSQTLTMMARNGGGLQGGTPHIPTLANCTASAQAVCGDDCVASVDYSVTVDENGNVTGADCAYECESPCTD